MLVGLFDQQPHTVAPPTAPVTTGPYGIAAMVGTSGSGAGHVIVVLVDALAEENGGLGSDELVTAFTRCDRSPMTPIEIDPTSTTAAKSTSDNTHARGPLDSLITGILMEPADDRSDRTTCVRANEPAR